MVAAMLMGCLALVAPWMIRNEIQLGTASLSTQAGLTLIGSYCTRTFDPHDETFGSFNGVCADGTAAVFVRYVKPPSGAAQWNEVSLDHQLTQSAEQFAHLHLAQLPRVIAAREVSTWALTGQGFQQVVAVYGGRNAAFEEIGGVVYWLLAAFALAGSVALARRSWRRLVVLLGPIVAVVVTVALLYGDTRFRVLAEPSLALLGLRRRPRHDSADPSNSLGHRPDDLTSVDRTDCRLGCCTQCTAGGVEADWCTDAAQANS